MSDADPPPSTPDADPAPWTELVVLVVDLVESVRLMQADERGTIRSWLQVIDGVRRALADMPGARIVKSLGDGLLLSFETVPLALALVRHVPALLDEVNRGRPDELLLSLRLGLHHTSALVTELDIFGAGINLCARIAGLAQPGQLLMSAAARDRLVHGLDGEVEDLGECYLKHVEGTCRVFRWHDRQPAFVMPAPPAPLVPLRPRLGVMPWLVPDAPGSAPVPPGLALALGDDLAAAMARSPQWLVTSRLSTAALAGRTLDAKTAGRLLGVDYLLVGELEQGGRRARVALRECHSGALVWEQGFDLEATLLFGPDAEIPRTVAAEVSRVVLARQLQVAHESALPTLAGYTLLLSGVGALYSCERTRSPVAHEMLQQLVDRFPRSPEAKAWLAKWYFMRLAQQTTTDRDGDMARARDLLARALDAAPGHALALALSGHMRSYVDGDTGAAERELRAAAAAGPNEPLAALFLAQVLRNRGRPEEAVEAIERAQALSPLDPMGYYYDLFAASAYSAAGQHERALALALRSLQQNALHLSTWVQVIIEQMSTGRVVDAQASARRYLALRPNASVRRYLERHPARGLPMVERDASALRAAGLPW
jgi:adenylate cyclase